MLRRGSFLDSSSTHTEEELVQDAYLDPGKWQESPSKSATGNYEAGLRKRNRDIGTVSRREDRSLHGSRGVRIEVFSADIEIGSEAAGAHETRRTNHLVPQSWLKSERFSSEETSVENE